MALAASACPIRQPSGNKETKLAKSEFRIRDAERDRKNDDLRIVRLDKVLEDVMAEVRREKAGLRARYESSPDAADRPLVRLGACPPR